AAARSCRSSEADSSVLLIAATVACTSPMRSEPSIGMSSASLCATASGSAFMTPTQQQATDQQNIDEGLANALPSDYIRHHSVRGYDYRGPVLWRHRPHCYLGPSDHAASPVEAAMR